MSWEFKMLALGVILLALIFWGSEKVGTHIPSALCKGHFTTTEVPSGERSTAVTTWVCDPHQAESVSE